MIELTPEIEASLIATLTAMSAAGHSARYIANHLNQENVPAAGGRAERWTDRAVSRFCAKHDVAAPKHNPARLAEVAAEHAAATALREAKPEAPDWRPPVYTEEQQSEARTYFGALSDTDVEYLREREGDERRHIYGCEAAVAEAKHASMDRMSEAVGLAKAALQAQLWLVDSLKDPSMLPFKAQWCRYQVWYREASKRTEETALEQKKIALSCWVQFEESIVRAEKAKAARMADPRKARIAALKVGIARSRKNATAALARIEQLKADVADDGAAIRARARQELNALGTSQGPEWTRLVHLTGVSGVSLRNDLAGAQYKMEKARRIREANIEELERLEAEGAPIAMKIGI